MVNFRRHDEIAFGQAVNLVGPQRDLDFAPGEQDVRVVPLLLGQLSNTVNALAAANRSIGGVILNGRVNPIPRWVRRVLFGEDRNEV